MSGIDLAGQPINPTDRLERPRPTPRAAPVCFFLAGVPKAGTTSLYHYLNAHPDVCMTVPKETGFFFENYERGVDWYEREYLSHYAGEAAVGEASVGTIYHREAPARVREYAPAAKMIVLLRDPVDRLYSHFNFDIGLGNLDPDTSFAEAIRDEASGWRRTMVGLGMYHSQIANLRASFPEEQIKILEYTDFKAHTAERVAEIVAFLGLPPFDLLDTETQHNRTRYIGRPGLYQLVFRLTRPLKALFPFDENPTLFRVKSIIRERFFTASRPPIRDPADIAYLSEIYRESNRKLGAAVELDISHWL